MRRPTLSLSRRQGALLAMALLAVLPLVGSTAGNASPLRAASFADPAFKKIWERTDAPVLNGQAKRSWYWGPAPGNVHTEAYSGNKSGTRMVQYFDKARMEINNPDGDRTSQWFVTTGLLVVEMVSERRQVGDKETVPFRAAEIAVGGDGLDVDPEAPTYTSFHQVTSIAGPNNNRAPNLVGKKATATIDRAGRVGSSDALGLYPGAKLAAYSSTAGHNIPQAMWDFLNLKGVVQQNGALVSNQSLADWVFVMGYPISEPYWARVKIDGVYHDVLFQLYERRTLAYIPSAPQGWQVQMGNVGAHYYRWVYGGPLPSPIVPTATPVSTPGPIPTVPPSIDATVSPSVVPLGTPVMVSIRGFKAGEQIAWWPIPPNGTITGAPQYVVAGPDGTVSGIKVETGWMTPGLAAAQFEGMDSHHQSTAYFYITEPGPPSTATRVAPTPTRTPSRTPVPPRGTPTATPTVPVVPTEPPGGLLLSVRPGYGSADTQFTFTAVGLAPGEDVQVTFTDPNGDELYPAGSNNGVYPADSGGRVVLALVPSQAFGTVTPGSWLFEVRGLRSGLEGVVGFAIQ